MLCKNCDQCAVQMIRSRTYFWSDGKLKQIGDSKLLYNLLSCEICCQSPDHIKYDQGNLTCSRPMKESHLLFTKQLHFFEFFFEPNALLYNIPEHLNPDQKDNSASHHLQNNTYSLPLQCLVPEASNGKPSTIEFYVTSGGCIFKQ